MTTPETKPQSLKFFRTFLSNARGVGAVCPSSQKLARAMYRDHEWRDGDVCVEYGPGTGSFTSLARDQLQSHNGAYLGIERESTFCDVLRRRMPDLRFVNGSVEDVRQHLEDAGLPRPRLIISGLPLILMPARTMEHIVRTTAEILHPGGSFRTFSYVHSWPARATRRLRSLMREHFDSFEMSHAVWWNCPPAFVLRGDRSA